MSKIASALLVIISVLLPSTALAGVFEAPVKNHEERIAELERAAQSLSEKVPVSGQFVQHKHLAILTSPLVSEGEFRLAEAGDFTWQVTAPYAVSYRQQEGVLERVIDGVTEKVNAANEPALFGFFQFFSRVFELDYSALAQMFEVYFEAESETRWQLGLIPRDSRLQRAIRQLLIETDNGQIARVTLMEPGGDYTLIEFTYPESAAP